MIQTEYRYQLESQRLTGRRQQKSTCPQCGRRKCFVRYVDTQNDYRYLDDSVGRCDHEQSCGYHYRPAEFYRDHPWKAEADGDYQGSRQNPQPGSGQTLRQGGRQTLRQGSQQTGIQPHCPPRSVPRPLQPLPADLVARSHSPQSNFWQWLASDAAPRLDLQPGALQHVYEDYLIGATSNAEVIFWQIDEQQRVRSGHIMQYGADGHRCGHQSWVHSRMMARGQLPADWELQQCLFGQHLLPQRPEAHVCIVESEKTALVLAARYPQLLWLATCGSGGLNAEKVECLRHRRFTLFPDSGCLNKWQNAMQQTRGLQFTIDAQLESYPPNTDLADLLLQ